MQSVQTTTRKVESHRARTGRRGRLSLLLSSDHSKEKNRPKRKESIPINYKNHQAHDIMSNVEETLRKTNLWVETPTTAEFPSQTSSPENDKTTKVRFEQDVKSNVTKDNDHTTPFQSRISHMARSRSRSGRKNRMAILLGSGNNPLSPVFEKSESRRRSLSELTSSSISRSLDAVSAFDKDNNEKKESYDDSLEFKERNKKPNKSNTKRVQSNGPRRRPSSAFQYSNAPSSPALALDAPDHSVWSGLGWPFKIFQHDHDHETTQPTPVSTMTAYSPSTPNNDSLSKTNRMSSRKIAVVHDFDDVCEQDSDLERPIHTPVKTKPTSCTKNDSSGHLKSNNWV